MSRRAEAQSEGTSLEMMSRATRMLAEATTIQQAKEVKNLALTAKDWARRKGLGEEAIQQCRSYALLAQRKMGEMLRAEHHRLAKGTRGQLKGEGPGGRIVSPPGKGSAPTLSIARANALAALEDLIRRLLEDAEAGPARSARVRQPAGSNPRIARIDADIAELRAQLADTQEFDAGERSEVR